jgi:hypothetical protein
MVFFSTFSALTTKPDGRKGRSPTIVRITRSDETLTGTNRWSRGWGVIDNFFSGEDVKPNPAPAAAAPATASKNFLRENDVRLFMTSI